MKKIISLILVLCLAAALFAGCETIPVAVEIAEAMDKTRALDSVDAEIVTTLKINTNSQYEIIRTTVDMQAKGLKSDTPNLSMEIETTGDGYSNDTHMYFEDQWMYYATDDIKYKTKVEDDGADEAYSETITELMQDIPPELLKYVKLKNQRDGSRSVAITLTRQQLTETYKNALDSITDALGQDPDNLLISNIRVVVAVKDGYITQYALRYHVRVNVPGVYTWAEVDIAATFKNPSAEVTVIPPAGYKNYPDMNSLGGIG